MFQWVLWRHAEAGSAPDDLSRPLTEQGLRQAHDSASWLKEQGIDYPGYCSQALRGRQTIACYCSQAEILSGLNPDNPLKVVQGTLSALQGKNAVIVGHLPWITLLATELVGQRVPRHDYSSLYWLCYTEEDGWQMRGSYRI